MILIIEPSHITAECIARACRPHHRTIICHDPVTALDLLDPEHPPGVIFINVNLPGANGIAFIHETLSHSEFSFVHFVVITNRTLRPWSSLPEYNVTAFLNSETLLPSKIKELADDYDHEICI